MVKRVVEFASVLSAGLIVAWSGLARADTPAEHVAYEMSEYADWFDDSEWPSFIFTGDRWAPTACTEKLQAAKKAGVKPKDVLTGNFKEHPKAKPSATADKFDITFADAPWVCEQFAKLFKLQQVFIKIQEAANAQANSTGPWTAESAKDYSPGAGKSEIASGRECLAGIEQALKDGVPANTKIMLRKGETTLGEARPFCQFQIDDGTALDALLTEAHKAMRAEIAKKYEDAGVSGAKLELFIEYDDVRWRGKKCEFVEDIKALAKAKTLFQWLENPDGTHTIRKYQFAGNKVKKVSDKVYKTEAKAYKGCV